MLEVVISFPLAEHLNNTVLNSQGNVSIQMPGKAKNSGNKLIQKKKQKNLLIFFQKNYSMPALWNLFYIHYLNTGYIANWATYSFWKKTLACIIVLLWTDLGVLFALSFMFLLLFSEGSVDLTVWTATSWVWLGWTQLTAFVLLVWQVCHLRTTTFCFLPSTLHSPVELGFSAIMPEFILYPAGTKIKLY